MMSNYKLLFSHPDFLIIHKPFGVSVHKDQQEQSFINFIAKEQAVSQLWLVHRLDKATSGLLILAKNAKTAHTFGEMFQQQRIQKTYLALSNKKPKKKQGWIKGDMSKARRGSWKLCKTMENPAITYFTSVGNPNGNRLFILHPKTGKTHQLRVAMKSLGSPILGDDRYGGEKAERMFLHAYRLQFDYEGENFDIKELPKSWILSEDILETL